MAVTVGEDGPKNGDDGGEGEALEVHQNVVSENIDENGSENRDGERNVFTGMKLRKALEPKTVKIKPRSMREIRVSIFMGNIDDV